MAVSFPVPPMEPESSGITLRGIQGCTVVEVTEELDIVTGSALGNALARAIRGPNRIVVDLTECEFCDVTAVRIIQSASRRAARRGGVVVISGAPDTLVKQVSSQGVGDLLLFNTRRQAIRALVRAAQVHPSWLLTG